MTTHEISEEWGPAEKAALETAREAKGSTTETGGSTAHHEVLARISDLERDDPQRRSKSHRSDGRLISQKLATRLLVGGVVVIALAAIVPSIVIPGILNKKTEAEGGRPTRPDAEEAPKFSPETAQTPAALPDSPDYQPKTSFETQVPPGPVFTKAPQETGEYEPSSTPPPWADSQLPTLPDLNQQQPVPHVGSQPQTSANETMRINNRTVPIPGQYWESDRPSDPVDRETVPTGIDSKGPQQWNLPSEPGVARFEGIITSPPIRTTYHGTGSGVY